MKFSKTRLIIPLILIILFSCKKDDDSDPPISNIMYEEYFNNNSDWPEFDDEYSAGKVENGNYIFEHKVEDINKWTSIYLYYDYSGDYTMETSLSILEKTDNFYHGIIWLRKDNYNHYYMYLHDDNFYIGYIYNYNHHSVSDITPSEAIKENGEANVLKVVKNGDHLDFYINGIKVYDYDMEFYVGDEFGFKLRSKGKIAIDYVKIYR